MALKCSYNLFLIDEYFASQEKVSIFFSFTREWKLSLAF